MLFNKFITAPSPTPRRYKLRTISTVPAIAQLMPWQSAASRCALPAFHQRDCSAASPAKTDPLGGLLLTVWRMRWCLLCFLLVLSVRRALAQGGYTITDLGVGN